MPFAFVPDSEVVVHNVRREILTFAWHERIQWVGKRLAQGGVPSLTSDSLHSWILICVQKVNRRALGGGREAKMATPFP